MLLVVARHRTARALPGTQDAWEERHTFRPLSATMNNGASLAGVTLQQGHTRQSAVCLLAPRSGQA